MGTILEYVQDESPLLIPINPLEKPGSAARRSLLNWIKSDGERLLLLVTLEPWSVRLQNVKCSLLKDRLHLQLQNKKIHGFCMVV